MNDTPPDDRRYAPTHQWARALADGQVEIGITAFAQSALGDVVFVELPAAGHALVAGEPFMLLESVKTASDVHAPLGGVVREVNDALREAPEALNDDPWSTWLVRIDPAPGEHAPLDAAAYRELLAR